MKKNKITFFAMELILLVLALFFVWKIFIQNVPEKRVAVILPESGDQRWDSLIKGMKQSAKENHIHLVICNTDDIENAEAEKEAIEEQKNNHIDAFIVLPAPGTDTKEMLTKEEIAWINQYHRDCFEKLAQGLSGAEAEFLKEVTKSI